ncbi:acyl-CoA dehydrogenase, partial [Mycobacterium sp. ITM-2017-0098]
MTIGLMPEQLQLADAVAQFAARHAPMDKTRESFDALAAGELPQWWDEFAANGFHAIHLPEEVGGQGGTLTDTAVMVEAASVALLPGPVLPTVTASAVAMLSGDGPAARA